MGFPLDFLIRELTLPGKRQQWERTMWMEKLSLRKGRHTITGLVSKLTLWLSALFKELISWVQTYLLYYSDKKFLGSPFFNILSGNIINFLRTSLSIKKKKR